MNPFVVAIGGAIIVSLFWVVIVGHNNHMHNKLIIVKDAEIFLLRQNIIHLENVVFPQYVVRDGGVDPVAQRNPPQEMSSPVFDLEEWGPGGGEVVKVGEQDSWDPLKGEYL